MRFRKLCNWFYSFTINSQSKSKNSAHYFWDIYQEKHATKLYKVSWWAVWVGDPGNFPKNCYFKNYYLYLRVPYLKTKKNLLQKDAKHLEVAWHSKRLKKEKEKRKIRKSQTTIIDTFLLLLCLIEKFMFCWETYLEKFSLYCYICITVFSRARLLRMH